MAENSNPLRAALVTSPDKGSDKGEPVAPLSGYVPVPYAPPGPRSGRRIKYRCPVCPNSFRGRAGMLMLCAGAETGAGGPHDPVGMVPAMTLAEYNDWLAR